MSHLDYFSKTVDNEVEEELSKLEEMLSAYVTIHCGDEIKFDSSASVVERLAAMKNLIDDIM